MTNEKVVLVSGAAVEPNTAGGSHSREFVQTFLLGKDPIEGMVSLFCVCTVACPVDLPVWPVNNNHFAMFLLWPLSCFVACSCVLLNWRQPLCD
jgi:hypothetical protein